MLDNVNTCQEEKFALPPFILFIYCFFFIISKILGSEASFEDCQVFGQALTGQLVEELQIFTFN